jgi:Caspase domain
MKRFALILEASRAKGHGVIDGCKRDAERLEGWLKSPAGGAWNNDEVKVVNNPWQFEIDQHKPSLDKADFATVTFSGHGRILEDSAGRRKQMVTLGDGSEIDFASLTPTASKKIMLCDACREVHVQVMQQKSIKAALSMFAEARSRDKCRHIFDKAVADAPPGLYMMYACSPNEYAGDDVLNGGFFTDALLSEAADWATGRYSTPVLRIADAFQAAAPKVSARGAASGNKQTPMASPSVRSGLPFPFAVATG